MRHLINLFVYLLDALEAAKGKRSFKRLYPPQSQQDGYRVVVSDGSTISIYCTEIVYAISYAKWWAPSRRMHLYSVHSSCSSTTPQYLINTFSKDFKVGNILHFLSPLSDRKKAAIDAYVDALLADV
jgi:hypothetical protein